jgi:hypothetical protein
MRWHNSHLGEVAVFRVLSAVLITLALSAGVGAHPHDEDTIVMMSGTLAKIDLEKGYITLDTVDKLTRSPKNVLMFLAEKPKLKWGKRKLTPADLVAGQKVTCIGEIEIDKQSRLVAFEIWVNDKPPATP